MFTDMVGSTEMTTQLGDTMAVELLKAHDAIIRRSLEQHGGSEVKHLGDGIMASFDDVPASVACAITIQQGFASYNEISEIAIRVRIGINAGEPVEESDDLFGSAVQMAPVFVMSPKQVPSLYRVRSRMRVAVSIWGLSRPVLKR